MIKIDKDHLDKVSEHTVTGDNLSRLQALYALTTCELRYFFQNGVQAENYQHDKLSDVFFDSLA